jgi:hypothetical protein
MMKNHTHEFRPGRSGSIETCRCGKFRFTAEYLKNNPSVVEVTDKGEREMRKATFKAMQTALQNAINDLMILSGEKVGPSDASWQDVAGTCVVNLRVLAGQIEQARLGNCESFISFPSPTEALKSEVAE